MVKKCSAMSGWIYFRKTVVPTEIPTEKHAIENKTWENILSDFVWNRQHQRKEISLISNFLVFPIMHVIHLCSKVKRLKSMPFRNHEVVFTVQLQPSLWLLQECVVHNSFAQASWKKIITLIFNLYFQILSIFETMPALGMFFCFKKTESSSGTFSWNHSAACDCGAEEQTVDHVVLQCPIHRPPHGPHGLTVLDDETTEWLLNTCPKI